METKIFSVDDRFIISEENKPYAGEYVAINGVRTKVGPGFQRIYRLYKIGFDQLPLKLGQISFFTLTLDDNDEYRSLKSTYLKTLCKAFVDPLSKLLKQVYNVALQA